MSLMISTKRFIGFPCTHRQWNASSDCRFVHGYSRSFYFEFSCKERSKEGWVVDFGGLKEIKLWLEHWFDHTFLIAEDDPFLDVFQDLADKELVQLRILPGVCMESTAEFVYQHVNPMIRKSTGGRAWISKLEVCENEKNSAIYLPQTLPV